MPPDNRNDTDRRSSAREKVIKGVEVIFNDGKSATPGLLANISDSGAKFVTNFPADLPRDVLLRFPTGEECRAEVTWNKNQIQFGLRLVDPVKV